MPSSEDIDLQRELLQAHRRTLVAYLKQQALAGGAQSAPIAVINGIAAARAEIGRVKAIMRDWGADVEHHPDDAGPDEKPALVPPVRTAVERYKHSWHPQSTPQWDIVRWWTLATIAGSAIGYGVSRGPGLDLARRLVEADVSWTASICWALP